MSAAPLVKNRVVSAVRFIHAAAAAAVAEEYVEAAVGGWVGY